MRRDHRTLRPDKKEDRPVAVVDDKRTVYQSYSPGKGSIFSLKLLNSYELGANRCNGQPSLSAAVQHASFRCQRL